MLVRIKWGKLLNHCIENGDSEVSPAAHVGETIGYQTFFLLDVVLDGTAAAYLEYVVLCTIKHCYRRKKGLFQRYTQALSLQAVGGMWGLGLEGGGAPMEGSG